MMFMLTTFLSCKNLLRDMAKFPKDTLLKKHGHDRLVLLLQMVLNMAYHSMGHHHGKDLNGKCKNPTAAQEYLAPGVASSILTFSDGQSSH